MVLAPAGPPGAGQDWAIDCLLCMMARCLGPWTTGAQIMAAHSVHLSDRETRPKKREDVWAGLSWGSAPHR
jgi:hypothetical protein